jgi:hypothetical protein
VARERLGELLLRLGVLTQAQLVSALREQARTGVRLGQILVDHGYVEEATLYDALARNTSLERFNLRTATLEKTAINLVTADWALEHGILPFKVDVQARTLYLALTDPTNLKPVDELSFRLGLKVKLVIASETELERIIRHHFHGQALDRDPRSARRPGQKQRTGDIDESVIMRGMDVMRDEVLKQSAFDDGSQFPGGGMPTNDIPQTPPTTGTIPPPAPMPVNGELSDEERAVLAQLKPIFDAQEEAARALRVIFELCVSRGIIGRDEYLERLKKTPD